jgi:co-chaperonin GroES (HSP10)
MRLKMFDDRLFVILEEVGEKKMGSIIIPGNHSERTRIGTVMEVGPGNREYGGAIIPMNYRVGDKVMVSWGAGTRIHLDGESMYGKPVVEDAFRVMRECEILGIVLED